MNNVWSVALRLPCRGPAGRAWTNTSICRSGIERAVAHERHQLLRRNFGTTPWIQAKLGKSSPESKAPVSRNRKPPAALGKKAAAPPPASSIPIPKPIPEAKEPEKPPEKATVQLSHVEVVKILGSGLSYDQGMDLLQELQYRRVTGSLSDKGLDFPERPEFTQEHRYNALEYLRETYPVDEEAAAMEYAEELAAEERRVLEERAMKLRIYKPIEEDADAEKAKEEEEIYINEEYSKIPLKADQTRDITSGSALQDRKDYVLASRKKAKIEAEKAAEEAAAEAEARGEPAPEPYRGHAMVVAKKTALEQARKDKHDKWEQLRKDAELDINAVQAKRSPLDRLWRPVLFAAVVISAVWLYADNYEPPKSSMRVFPSIAPGTATIAVIAGINLVMLLMWRHPYAWKYMNRYFLASPGDPRAFSILGAIFSHQTLNHWWWNMGTFYLVGSVVHEETGRGTFLALYLTSGIMGYLLPMSINILSNNLLSATLGASCAVFGMLGAFLTLSPTRSITLFEWMGGKYEFPTWLPLAAFVVYEALLWRRTGHIIEAGTDHLSHVAGMVTGAVAGYLVRRRLEKERAEDADVASLMVEQKPTEAMTPLSTTVVEEKS